MRFKTIWTDAKVIEVADVAANVRLITLQPTEGAQRFSAGAHIDVSVLVNDLPEVRSYSLVGTYSLGGSYQIAVKRLTDSRGGSNYMWSLALGARLSISQPKNQFQLTFLRPYYTLLAGGIGITPIYGMVQELLQKGADFHLYYAGSSRAEMPFVDELHQQLGDRVSFHISDEGTRLDIERLIANVEESTQMYVCGPMRMLDAVRAGWNGRNLPPGDLRYETFAASGEYAPQTFQVSLPRFGKTITVQKNQTMLDALNENGIEVMEDCLRGECGLCVVDVLDYSGTIDHRDLFFSDEQKADNKKMCACVSRIVNGIVTIDTAYRGHTTTVSSIQPASY